MREFFAALRRIWSAGDLRNRILEKLFVLIAGETADAEDTTTVNKVIVSINKDAALAHPGVLAVLTAEDIPGENGLSDYSREEPVLTPVGETVRMVGAPIALVVAETPATTKIAATPRHGTHGMCWLHISPTSPPLPSTTGCSRG